MLGLAARHGRHLLIFGLAVGIGSPAAAAALRPWVPEVLAVLLFLNAFRTAPRLSLGRGTALRRALAIVLALQLALPLAILPLLLWTGLATTSFAFAAVLMMSAPAITGAPNFVVMTGHDPVPAMRLLILGTALFPLTILPVLWIMPGIEATEALGISARMAAILLAVVAGGLMARRLSEGRIAMSAVERGVDGVSSILLAIVVIGLMSAVGPLLRADPVALAGWIAATGALNLALQLAALGILTGMRAAEAVGASVVAGNRNIALYLLALPDEVMRPALVFIGCYQIPMFLTPLLMRRLHAAAARRSG